MLKNAANYDARNDFIYESLRHHQVLCCTWITGNLFTMTQTIVLRKGIMERRITIQKARKTPLGMK